MVIKKQRYNTKTTTNLPLGEKIRQKTIHSLLEVEIPWEEAFRRSPPQHEEPNETKYAHVRLTVDVKVPHLTAHLDEDVHHRRRGSEHHLCHRSTRHFRHHVCGKQGGSITELHERRCSYITAIKSFLLPDVTLGSENWRRQISLTHFSTRAPLGGCCCSGGGLSQSAAVVKSVEKCVKFDG